MTSYDSYASYNSYDSYDKPIKLRIKYSILSCVNYYIGLLLFLQLFH